MKKIPVKKTKKWPCLRPAAIVFSLLVAFVGQYFFYQKANARIGLALFAAAAVIFIAADFFYGGKDIAKEKPAAQPPSKKEILIFALIIMTAGFFRFYKIDTLPAGAHRDEAKAALDAICLSEGKEPPLSGSKLPLYIPGITENPAAYNYVYELALLSQSIQKPGDGAAATVNDGHVVTVLR